MKRYYVEIEGNIIKNPAEMSGEGIEEIEIIEPFLEVTEEFYAQYKDLLPATFELDEDGSIINVMQLQQPEPELIIVTEPADEEKAFLAEAVIQLSNEIEILKQEINKLKGGN